MAQKRRWFLWLFVVAFLVLFTIGYFSGHVQQRSVLVLELSGALEEQKPPGAWGATMGNDITVLYQLLDSIDAAKGDSRITGLVVKISNPGGNWAKLEEIRQHLTAFAASGKPAICFLSGDFNRNRDYYVATGCSQIWLMPSSPLAVSGLMTESQFYRGIFDKLRIYPDFYHIAEYKTAANQYTEKKYTPAHREMADSILRATYAQYTGDVGSARKMEPSEVDQLLQQGPFLADESLKSKLVDRLAYYDEVQQFFLDRNQDWRPVELAKYFKQIRNPGSDKIAVVHATGLIVVGESQWTPFSGFIMGSDSVAADLRVAANDSSVKSIVLRIDSPGGSSVASEIIHREVQMAQKKKPVVVSMSDVAGSGGYWIAMSSNRIVADAGTLTGSIGVVFGKMNISGLYDLIGLSTDHLQTSDNATFLWPEQNFTPEQQAAVQKLMHKIYDDFTAGVAAGRHMTVEQVDLIGRGRVWTGEQAKGIGLIDEVGGYSRAVAIARELGHVAGDAKTQIVHYPREKSFLESIWASSDDHESTSFVDLLKMSAGNKQTVTAAALASELRRAATREGDPVQVRMPIAFDIR